MTEALFRRNLRAFSRHQPRLAAALKAVQPTAVLERDGDGIPTNLCIGSERLYAGPAQAWADGQVKGFLADGQRILFTNAFHCNLTDSTIPFFNNAEAYCHERIGPLSAAPLGDVGFAFVFGVGLGCHVEQLLLRAPVRNLVLIEPVLEFLWHSLSVVDWAAIFRLAAKQGRKLHFITAEQPDQIVRMIENCLLEVGNDFIDGSYFYFHYYSWALRESYSNLLIRVRHHYYSTGFFEDEKKMMTNACANMRRHSFHICEDQPFVRQTTPVFIVGSGPSLDNDLDFIRHWRDKVVLISSGTSLGILLKHGLRPDIHTEMENGPQIFPILAPLRDKYGFHGIRLGASLTIDPAIGELFDQRWFFLRTALSPSLLLSQFHKGLKGSDPTVANASFSIAAVAGFTDIYLFGVDCGYREGTDEQHHSQHSIYFTADKPEGTDDIVKRHDRILPGNFGGKFRTQWSFDMTARVISDVRQRSPAMRLFNCSDGARIDGTQPKAAEAIDLSHLPARGERVLEQVERQMTRYQSGELLRRLDRKQLVAGCHVLSEAMVAALTKARRRRGGFWELREDLRTVYEAHRTESLGAIAMAGPTVVNALRAAAFLGVRIADERARRAYLRHVTEELEVLAVETFRQAAEVFETLLAEDEVHVEG
jgi:hypothetical protein